MFTPQTYFCLLRSDCYLDITTLFIRVSALSQKEVSIYNMQYIRKNNKLADKDDAHGVEIVLRCYL